MLLFFSWLGGCNSSSGGLNLVTKKEWIDLADTGLQGSQKLEVSD